ncbi:hypothetical protein B0O99DRAFT_718899 [Bisporella sp. PMI_857]|nr:hypothetical protein B0O99DRAFT_718899 [Bisporella sp. PMI_857]
MHSMPTTTIHISFVPLKLLLSLWGSEQHNLPIITWLLNRNVAEQLIIVNDGSPDGTVPKSLVVKQLAKPYAPHVPLKACAGKARPGYHGLQFVTGNFAIIMDADFSHYTSFISQMIAKQKPLPTNGGYDIVTGTRYYGGGAFMMAFETKICEPWYRLRSYGSFRLYKKGGLQKDIYIKAVGCTVAEVPISGESNLGSDKIVEYAKGVLTL